MMLLLLISSLPTRIEWFISCWYIKPIAAFLSLCFSRWVYKDAILHSNKVCTDFSPLPPWYLGIYSLSIPLLGWKLPFILMILRVLISISFNSSIFQSIIPKVGLMTLVTNVLCAVALLYAESSEDHNFLHLM